MFHVKDQQRPSTYSNSDMLPIKLSLSLLNNFIGIIFRNDISVSRKSLTNIQKLIKLVDDRIFDHDESLEVRFFFIQRALEARLDKGFENRDAILSYCVNDATCKYEKEILANLEYYSDLTEEEINYVNRTVEDRLNYSYILDFKAYAYDIFDRMESGDFSTYQDACKQLNYRIADYYALSRKIKNSNRANTFKFDDPNVMQNLIDIATRLRDPSRLITTGIQKLNGILAPGLFSKKLYAFFGLPGSFKSGILISLAYWCKVFNLRPRKISKRKPTVIYITLENDIDETVERLFNMAVKPGDIRNYTPKQVAEMFRDDSKLFVDGNDDIVISMYYFGNREKDTMDIAALLDDIRDDGYEPVMLIIDYLKRLRPHERARDEKEELKHLTNELKNIAIEFDIPVVTAQQLNREGQKAIDSAAVNNKENLTHLLGRGNISTAWEILENIDWGCVINMEKQKSTNKDFLTFKRLKIRYRDPNDEIYFNHPFDDYNKMRLLPDIHLDEPLSVVSLSSDMETIDVGVGRRIATNRDIDDEDLNSIDEIFKNAI